MAFTPFIDDLGLVEALIVLTGCILTYLGIAGWWAMRKGDVNGLKNALKGAAIPIGISGAVMLVIALWGEMVWPFPAAFMGGYDIFFQDVMVLFGMVMVAYAVTAYYSLCWQYMGIFAMVAGSMVAYYGYSAYTAALPFTKDPYTTYMMYLGFAAAGIAALPAGIIVDLYIAAAEGRSTFWKSISDVHLEFNTRLGIRGVGSLKQPETTGTETFEDVSKTRFRMSILAQIVILAFPVLMALATFAALSYFGLTIQGHLAGGPGKAP